MSKLTPISDAPPAKALALARPEQVDWSPLADLAIGQGLVAPEDVNINRIGSALTYWGRKLGRSFIRSGRRIWRRS